MVTTGRRLYCFCALVYAIVLELASGTTNCTTNNTSGTIPHIICNVWENVDADTLVFDAKDDPRFNMSNLRFQIYLGNFEASFSRHFVIDTTDLPRELPNGELRTQGGFDREQMFDALDESQNGRDQITWTALLRIIGSSTGTGTFQLYINVIDINDNIPTFPVATALINSDEGDAHNVTLSEFLVHTAVDTDERHNAVQDYTLIDDYDGLFTLAVRLNPVEDTVRLESTLPLDREKRSTYDFVVIARDGGNKTGMLNVTLMVNDINDNFPVVEMSSYSVIVIENSTSVVQPVIDINATDDDDGSYGTLTYSMTVENDDGVDVTGDGVFVINQSNGEITTNSILDREDVPSYHLTVTIRDGGESPKSVIVIVNVEVNDTNDNPPEVSIDANRRTGGNVREDSEIGLSIATMTVTDPDEGRNGMFTVGELVDLGIEDGSPSQIGLQHKVSPQNNTWDLIVVTPLDRETRESYKLQITVTDHGVPSLNTIVNYSFSLHDVNDNAPVFNTSYYESVREDTRIGDTVVQNIRAYDRDIGSNSNLNYSLSPASADFPYQDFFSIRPTVGNLMVARSLDRETVPELDVQVVATDMGTPSKSGNTSIHLVLIDVNDNRPIFASSTASNITVMENSSPGHIYTFSATDPDLPPYANVTYSLNPASNFFMIDPITGELNTTQQLDRENIEVHHIKIGASDSLLSPQYINFTVVVGDVNDVPPRFDRETYADTIAENATINTVVTELIVVDPDLDNGLQFSIESGNDEGKFSVNTRGEVVVAAGLDRETTAAYTLFVSAMDGAGLVATNRARVLITVSDINDHPPQFNRSSYVFYVTEELGSSINIGDVSAFSNDAGQNGIVSYNITGGNAGGYFSISSNDGTITAGPGIDRELNEMFELSITAQDGGHPPLFNTTTVTVLVRDVNDNGPIFNPASITVSLREDHSLMQSFYIATAVDADEGDNANTTYSIVSSTYGNFHIDATTGAVSLVSTLDYETATSVLVVIEAVDSDQSNFTDRLYLNVSVEDIDDRLPRFPSDFPTSLIVNESAPSGHVILRFQAVISATSPARDFGYSLSDHMDDFTLSVVSNEALLEVVSLDREDRSGYVLNITIINTVADLRNSKLLNITVSDTNDNSPVFNMPQYSFEVIEESGGADVGSVVADDSDDGVNSMIHFAIMDSSSLFRIDRETGKIQTLVPLDYDTVREHTLMILATDMGNPSKSTSATVSISVIDVNDNPPEFLAGQMYEFTVFEDASVGKTVGTIEATDVDSGDFGTITYDIQAGNVGNRFSIVQEGRNGMITVNAPLDRESLEEYNLNISLSDNNNRPHSHRIHRNFTITVRDVNDNSPVFSDAQMYSAAVPENEPAIMIATISANDADTGPNSRVNYMLGAGNYNNAFSIDRNSGDLRVQPTAHLDYETNAFYTLEVIAYDGGSPTRRTVQLFTVNVTNVNDHTPQFTLALYEFSVREGSSSTSAAMRVQAVDDDSGVMGEVMYRITSQIPASDFTIDSRTGEIRPISSLNYEHHSEYELVVEAVDMDQTVANRRTGDTLVRVVVENINDNSPSFLNLPHTIRLSEMVPVNTIAYVALAVDADTDTLQFSIAGGNHDDKFTMNTQTGEVLVSSSLDRDVVSSYDLIISVTDGSMTENGVLTIEVEDVNDNTPVFVLSPYTINVSEGASVGDVVGRIIATDADEGFNAQLEYTLVEASEYFSIDSSSGNLTLLLPLDRDNSSMPNPITLEVRVTDMGILSWNSNTTSVDVNITDINDSPPIFTRPTFRFTIPRDFSVGEMFGLINATDADEGTNAEHLFNIVHSPQGLNLFSLNHTSGELSLAMSLGEGSLRVYSIQVRVVDLRNQMFQDVASVEIVVTDTNDHPPVFPQEKYSISLTESSVTPQSVLMVTATDDDNGRNGQITYRFAEAQPHFTINQSTGDIVLTDSLDHEHTPVFTLLVYAVNNNGRNSSTIVNIDVLDVNDNRPQFQDLPASLTISEVPYTGLDIVTALATDRDSGSFGEVTHSLVTEAARNQFNIDNVTGVVTNLVELTAGTTHTLEFEATDGGGERNRISITLTVADLSSQSPDFNRETASVMVREDFPINNVIQQFNASSLLDSQVPIQYRLSNCTDEVFSLNKTTGELMLVSSLDFEQAESYHFIIESFQVVSDTQYSSYLEVVIVVQDVNDNAPVFTNAYVVVTDVRESTNMDHHVTTVYADDLDSENNGRVNYAIIDGNEGEVFSIGPTNGQIVVVRSLDRESMSTYRLTVTATDEGTPPLSATAVVAVGISDDNDVTPRFRNASYVFRVPENSTLRSLVGVVSAVDADLTSAQLHYIISSLTASLDGAPVANIPLTYFHVNRVSGEILLNHNLNRAMVDKYELRVNVTDGVNANSTSVTIIVQDSNNNRPMFITDGAIHAVSIPELSDVGMQVFQFTARDADFGLNGIVRYSLGDDWATGQFSIDPVTGIVSLWRAAPLYQASSNGVWETGTVIASDLGDVPQYSSITVTVNLFDINNHPPSLPPMYSGNVFDITEMGTEVLTITADDQDEGANANVSYYIFHEQGPISVPFTIDRTTGRITVNGKLTPDNVVFTVTAINEDPDPFAAQFVLSNTTRVEIRVNRMNIYPPQFNQSTYPAMILESEDTGTNIVQVYATDDDEDTTISYTIQSSTGALPFAIDANGLISIRSALDREITDLYDIVIVATDDGVPRRSGTTRVQINILDVNDNKPEFGQDVFEALVMENVQKGTQVTTITANDNDLLENAEISYDLNDTSVFNIDPQTGRIFTNAPIDREAVAMYHLEILATDRGNPVQSSSAVVLVSVGGENEFEPNFNDSQQVFFQVPAGLTVGSVVGRLYAFDGDEGSEGELKYTFSSYEGSVNPNDYFYINSSGFIILNFTAQGVHSNNRRKRQTDDDSDTDHTPVVTVVKVEDSGTNPRSDEIEITLSVATVHISQSPSSEANSDSSPTVVVIAAAVGSAVLIAVAVLIVVCAIYRYRQRGRNKLYSPSALSDAEPTRPSIVSFTPSTANGIVHSDPCTETTGTRLTAVQEAGHAQVSTTSDSEPASGIFGDDESESVSGMQSRARANNQEHVSPNGRHRSPQHSRPPPISRSTSDLAAAVNSHNSNGFLRRPDDEEAHPYTRDQLIAIYAANANLLTNSPSQDSIHMFGSEGGGEADGDIDMDNYMFAKFGGGLDSADEESIVGINNDAYTVSSRGRSSIASRSSGGGIDEGPEDLWRGSRQLGFRPHRVTDVIDEMHVALSQESLSQSKEKRKPKPLPHMMQFQETSFTKKQPTSGSYTRHTGSMQNVRYPDHVGNSQYEGYDGRRSSKSHYASSGAIYPLSYSSRASELTLPPYRAGEAPPPYVTELSPPIIPVNPNEMRRGSQSSDSDSSEYPAPNPPVTSYGPQPISPQPSLPTTNSTISLDNPIFQSPLYSKHYKAAKGAIPHPHSGSVPQINMYNAGSVHASSIGQGLDRQQRYNVNNGNLRA